DDPAQAHPAVGGGTHGAVLTRGVDGGHRSLRRGHVGGGPASDGELGVLGAVAARHSVAILESDPTVAVDQHRTERLVAGRERLGGELDAPLQVAEVGRVDHSVGAGSPASSAATWDGSTLAPETTTATGPANGSTLPSSSAATPTAAAPSATRRCWSNRKRIAFQISSSSTNRMRSTMSRTMVKV